MLSKGPRGSKVPKRPRAVCVFAPVTRHAWSHGRDSCDCNHSMVERKRMFQTPQRTNRPQKNRKSELEIICGPSPAGHGGRAEARSAKKKVGSGFIPAAAHVEPRRERPEEESLTIQLDCPALTQKNLMASDPTNPSGPYYKDTSRSEPTKQQKKTKQKNGHLGVGVMPVRADFAVGNGPAGPNISGPREPLVL
jgi:hypothetical protein